MLTDLEICKKIAGIAKPENLDYDRDGCPVISVQSVAEWIDYNPVDNAGQLKTLVKAYLVSSEFQGAGVVSRAHIHVNDTLVYGAKVFDRSYERSILMSIITLFSEPELEGFINRLSKNKR
jgi:hypothetical protein